MKVLFAGIPGTRKMMALQNLKSASQRLFPDEPIFSQKAPDGTRRLPIFEDYLYGQNPIWFLKQSQSRQKQRWREVFSDIRAGFDRAATDHHFLGMHLTFRYEQIPSCVADFQLLLAWKPDCIVTFIDDAYCMRERIHRGGYTSFTLEELLLWRSEELLIADLLARLINPQSPPPNYLVSVKHSAEGLARLLMQHEQIVRPYLSYNITATRADAPSRGATDAFRERMRRLPHCFCFDPLTIDELPPILSATAHDLPGQFQYNADCSDHRWPVDGTGLLTDDDDIKYPMPIPLEELRSAKNAVLAQVKHRDIRLIDQADYLIVYRPTLTGTSKLSSGVQGEVDHAAESGCPVVWYVQKGVDPLPESPFVPRNPGDDPDFFYDETDERFWARIATLKRHAVRGREGFLR